MDTFASSSLILRSFFSNISVKYVIIHDSTCLLSTPNLEVSIFGGSLMAGCLLSIFLGVLLGSIMKFTVPYVNARHCPCRQPARGESTLAARWSMQRRSSQLRCSQYIIKITAIVASNNVLFFVNIKYFCRWISNL